MSDFCLWLDDDHQLRGEYAVTDNGLVISHLVIEPHPGRDVGKGINATTLQRIKMAKVKGAVAMAYHEREIADGPSHMVGLHKRLLNVLRGNR